MNPVYRKCTHTDKYLDYNSNHPISAKLYVIHTLIHIAKQVCSTSEFLAKEMDNLHKDPQDNHYTAQFLQQTKPQLKTNKKPKPSIQKITEGTRVVIPYIKHLSEQYRHTLAKYKLRVFFKGTSNITFLFMHPKYPIPDAQKTDIIYHWKCSAHNCTVACIGETNRSLRELQTIEIKPPVPSETTISLQITQKQNLKRFHNNRQRQKHPTPLSKRSISHWYQ